MIVNSELTRAPSFLPFPHIVDMLGYLSPLGRFLLQLAPQRPLHDLSKSDTQYPMYMVAP